MELKVWSKTLLSIYRHLFKLTRAIDKMVLEFGLNSCRFCGVCGTYNSAQKIIELTDRKVNLINLKVLIEKVLTKVDDVSCKILTLKFIDRMSNETIMDVLDIKRRTYFRKYQSALNSFANMLLIEGYNNEKIVNLIGSETWIFDVYKEIFNKEVSKKSEGEISNLSILNLAIKDYNTIKKNKFMI